MPVSCFYSGPPQAPTETKLAVGMYKINNSKLLEWLLYYQSTPEKEQRKLNRSRTQSNEKLIFIISLKCREVAVSPLFIFFFFFF